MNGHEFNPWFMVCACLLVIGSGYLFIMLLWWVVSFFFF